MAEAAPKKKIRAADCRILAVDDDDAVLMMLKTTLEIEGFQVRTGRDGRNILQRAVEYKPNLIVADLMMPGGGGYELLRSLQSDPDTMRIPVIIITGSNLDASTQAMMKQESNLVGYIQKPLRGESLVRQIHKILNSMSVHEEMTMNRTDVQAPNSFDQL